MMMANRLILMKKKQKFEIIYLQAKIENPLGTPLLKRGEKSNDKFISNLVFEEHVKQKLKDLNPLKSPGAGNIHPKVLKELSNSLAKPLI